MAQPSLALKKELKRAYQFYVDGNYDAFETTMKRIVDSFLSDFVVVKKKIWEDIRKNLEEEFP